MKFNWTVFKKSASKLANVLERRCIVLARISTSVVVNCGPNVSINPVNSSFLATISGRKSGKNEPKTQVNQKLEQKHRKKIFTKNFKQRNADSHKEIPNLRPYLWRIQQPTRQSSHHLSNTVQYLSF